MEKSAAKPLWPDLPSTAAKSRDPFGARAGESADDEQARIRRMVQLLSQWMDTAFEIPGLGWRFGLDALIGLVPGVGDAATTMVSLYLITLASRCGLPRLTVARMALNVAIDMLVGSLPLVGDVFDVWWKANQKNATLLQQRLAEGPSALRRSSRADGVFVTAVLAGLVVLFVALAALSVAAAVAIGRAIAGLF